MVVTGGGLLSCGGVMFINSAYFLRLQRWLFTVVLLQVFRNN